MNMYDIKNEILFYQHFFTEITESLLECKLSGSSVVSNKSN